MKVVPMSYVLISEQNRQALVHGVKQCGPDLQRFKDNLKIFLELLRTCGGCVVDEKLCLENFDPYYFRKTTHLTTDSYYINYARSNETWNLGLLYISDNSVFAPMVGTPKSPTEFTGFRRISALSEFENDYDEHVFLNIKPGVLPYITKSVLCDQPQ